MKKKYTTRWMIRKDINQILRIEDGAAPRPQSSEEILKALAKRFVIGKAVIDANAKDRTNVPIYGYMIYRLDVYSIEILSLVVDKMYQANGIGKMLIEELKSKLHKDKRTLLKMSVDETNLSALNFLKKNEFLAVDIIKGGNQETGEDKIVMTYDLLELLI